MEGVKNFRDLGGIPTQDGRRVKSGLFFRSALIDYATADDIEYLKGLHIAEVYDYRDANEVGVDGLKKYDAIGARHRNFPTDITIGKLFKLQNGGIERAFIKIKDKDVEEYYRMLPFSGEGYKEMVKGLIEGRLPMLQHCTAGKDRAGMGSALLLAILGVGCADITKDYLESVSIAGYISELMRKEVPKVVWSLLHRKYALLFTVKENFINAAYDAIIEKYGTFDNYLSEVYGLTPPILTEIRGRYTE